MSKEDKAVGNALNSAKREPVSEAAADLVLVAELNPNDVLLVRVGGTFNTAGNQRLRELIQSHRDEYVSISTPSHRKREIVHDIIEAIGKAGGRFVQQSVRDDQVVWSLASESRIGNKIRRSLRHGKDLDSTTASSSPAAVPKKRRRKLKAPTVVGEAMATAGAADTTTAIPTTAPAVATINAWNGPNAPLGAAAASMFSTAMAVPTHQPLPETTNVNATTTNPASLALFSAMLPSDPVTLALHDNRRQQLVVLNQQLVGQMMNPLPTQSPSQMPYPLLHSQLQQQRVQQNVVDMLQSTSLADLVILLQGQCHDVTATLSSPARLPQAGPPPAPLANRDGHTITLQSFFQRQGDLTRQIMELRNTFSVNNGSDGGGDGASSWTMDRAVETQRKIDQLLQQQQYCQQILIQAFSNLPTGIVATAASATAPTTITAPPTAAATMAAPSQNPAPLYGYVQHV